MAESYEDQVHRLARYIVWASYHPHPDPRIAAAAAAEARKIRRRADELGRNENLRAVSGENVISFPVRNDDAKPPDATPPDALRVPARLSTGAGSDAGRPRGDTNLS
jgi:hypothetical protein